MEQFIKAISTPRRQEPQQEKTTLKLETVLGRQLEELLSAWKANPELCGQDEIIDKLEWFVVRHPRQRDSLGAYFLRDESSVRGHGFFLRQNRPLGAYLGEIKIMNMPIQCVRFAAPPVFPDDAEAYDKMLGSIREMGAVHGFFVRSLPLDSFFYKYLQTSPLVRSEFLLYSPVGRLEHFVVRLPDTFEEYLQKFSSKSRSNLRRGARKLQKDTGMEVKLVRITLPEQVDSFVDSAVEISKKTYQWRLAGSGLRVPEVLKRNFKFLAERGRLRCYLLSCGGKPCAFMLCDQWNGVCYSPAVGYDPRWEQYSVGTTLQFLVIEDLFVHDRPNVFDFGTGMGGQKELFGNASFFDTDIYILRKGLYTRLASGVHKAGSALATGTKRALAHYDLKKRVKKLIRQASAARSKEESKPQAGQSKVESKEETKEE
jgi:hypothetical protein